MRVFEGYLAAFGSWECWEPSERLLEDRKTKSAGVEMAGGRTVWVEMAGGRTVWVEMAGGRTVWVGHWLLANSTEMEMGCVCV